MSGKMKAAMVREYSAPLTIEEIDMPAVTKNRVLVKAEACGVCHTGLHAVDGDWPVKPPLPIIPGHEGVGIVAAVGAGTIDGRIVLSL